MDKWFACEHEVLARREDGSYYHIADTKNKKHSELIAKLQNEYVDREFGFQKVKEAMNGR